MDTSNSTFRLLNRESILFTVKYCGLSPIFSAEYVGIGYINDGSTMDQRWINDVSLTPPSPPLVAPDDSWLELATPPLRKVTEVVRGSSLPRRRTPINHDLKMQEDGNTRVSRVV